MAVSDEEMNIVLARLRAMPRTIQLNIGAFGSFTRDQLIEAVTNRNEIGDLIVEMQMTYIRSFKERVNK